MFTETFHRYICGGESISCEVEGFTIRARLIHDEDSGEPWKNCDGHGPVTEWVQRDKKPGELVLSNSRHSKRFYDYAAACDEALRDGWGLEGGKREGESDKAYAARAAMHDFEVLKAWCNDEWHYYGVSLSVSKGGITLDSHAASLWGIEGNYPGSDNSYFNEVAAELLPQALEAGKAAIAALCACEGAGA